MATYGRIRSTRLLVVGLLVASLVTITLDARGGDTGPLAFVGKAVGTVVGTLQEGVSAVFRPVGEFFGNVFRAGSLAERVTALEEENAELRTQLQGTLSDRATIRQYEEINGLSESLRLEKMGAIVIGESGSNFEWAVTIDKGSGDGVTDDMPVISGQGLVGRVVEVYPGTATVRLIIDPDSHVSARLAASQELGVVEGAREEPLRFTLADPETEIQPGEPVETASYRLESGFEGIFPASIPIGVVERVQPSDDGITLEVLVRPNVDFSRLSTVYLVTGQSEAPSGAGEERPS